jgi:hypothetical protein
MKAMRTTRLATVVAVAFGITMALGVAGLFRQSGSAEQALAQSGTERENRDGRPEIPKVGQRVAAPLTALAKTRTDAARRAYDEAMKLLKQVRVSGEFLIPEGKPGDVYSWSVRWLNAQRDMGSEKADQIAALEDHLKRMKALQQLVSGLSKTPVVSPLDSLAAEYYRAESEFWLAQERAR